MTFQVVKIAQTLFLPHMIYFHVCLQVSIILSPRLPFSLENINK